MPLQFTPFGLVLTRTVVLVVPSKPPTPGPFAPSLRPPRVSPPISPSLVLGCSSCSLVLSSMSTSHKLSVPVVLPADHVVVAATHHERFVLCSECMVLADPETGIVWRQDGTRGGLDCARAVAAASAPQGAIPPDLFVQLIRAARLPSPTEWESERRDLAVRLGDPALRVPVDTVTRPSVQLAFEGLTFDLLHSSVAALSALVDSILALRPQERALLPEVRMDRNLGCSPTDVDLAVAVHIPMGAIDGFASSSTAPVPPPDGTAPPPAPAAAAAAGGAGGGGGGGGGRSTSASASAPAPPPLPRPARPPPPGAVVVPLAAAVAFVYRQLTTALGVVGLSSHAGVACKAWASTGTSAFTAGPDGGLVPVGFYWHCMRLALDNDVAIRLPSILRVPAPSFDIAMAPLLSPRSMTAHGAASSILHWMPRLGLLLASRRNAAARALLASTWREWHDALLLAAASTRKEYKALGLTATKRRRGDDDADAGAGAGPAVPP